MFVSNAIINCGLFIGLALWWAGLYILTHRSWSKTTPPLVVYLLFSAINFIPAVIIFGFPNVTQGTVHLLYQILWWTLPVWVVSWSHLTASLLPKSSYRIVLKAIWIFYGVALLSGILVTSSNLLIDFSQPINIINAGYFFKPGILYPIFLIATFGSALMAMLVWISFLKHNHTNSTKYGVGLSATILNIVGGIFHVLVYYQIFGSSLLWVGTVFLGSSSLLSIAAIIFWEMFVVEADLQFGKEFLISAVTIGVIVIVYWLIMLLLGGSSTFLAQLTMILLLFIVVSSHAFYDVLQSVGRNIVFEKTISIPYTTDEEVGEALRHYNNEHRLEHSSLLRLSVLKYFNQDKVKALKRLIDESIEYFKPNENEVGRSRKNLKYEILKMIAFRQAKEGQIIWELGFEEYPLRIMGQENQLRKPRLPVQAPSDYSAISRNAYLALRQEAVHDLAWRINYLEKNTRKNR